MEACGSRTFCLKNRPFKVAVCTVTLVAFLFTIIPPDITWALTATPAVIHKTEPGSSSVGSSSVNTGAIIIPEALGSIKESWTGAKSKSTIIHIQDAHCNYFAQIKIAEIIKYLNDNYDVNTINLEGGAKNYDLSLFTGIKDKVVREKTVDHFVKEGVLNGAEYFAANNSQKVSLWGIEDTKLYIENLRAYRDSLAYKAAVDKSLKNLNYVLSNLKTKIYSKELLELDRKANAYKEKSVELKDYIAYLTNLAKSQGINLSDLENIGILAKTTSLEPGIDFKRANIERDELVDRLTKALSRVEVKELVEKAVGFKLGRLMPSEFYSYLINKSKELRINPDVYKNLALYIRYTRLYSTIKNDQLFKELNILEGRITEKLYQNQTQRELHKLSKNLAIIKNIFGITLTPDEYKYYKSHQDEFRMENYVDFVNSQASLHGFKFKLDKDILRLDDYLEKIGQFYTVSLKRDSAFLKNLKIGKTTILITGGFHSENLAELFKKNNISYVSIMPNFKNEDGYECPYFKLLSGQKKVVLAKEVQKLAGQALAYCSPNTPLAREVNVAMPLGVGVVLSGPSPKTAATTIQAALDTYIQQIRDAWPMKPVMGSQIAPNRKYEKALLDAYHTLMSSVHSEFTSRDGRSGIYVYPLRGPDLILHMLGKVLSIEKSDVDYYQAMHKFKNEAMYGPEVEALIKANDAGDSLTEYRDALEAKNYIVEGEEGAPKTLILKGFTTFLLSYNFKFGGEGLLEKQKELLREVLVNIDRVIVLDKRDCWLVDEIKKAGFDIAGPEMDNLFKNTNLVGEDQIDVTCGEFMDESPKNLTLPTAFVMLEKKIEPAPSKAFPMLKTFTKSVVMAGFAYLFYHLGIPALSEIINDQPTTLNIVNGIFSASMLTIATTIAAKGLSDILIPTPVRRDKNTASKNASPNQSNRRGFFGSLAQSIAVYGLAGGLIEAMNRTDKPSRYAATVDERIDEVAQLTTLYDKIGFDKIQFVSRQKMYEIAIEAGFNEEDSRHIGGLTMEEGDDICVAVPGQQEESIDFNTFSERVLKDQNLDPNIYREVLRTAYHEGFHAIMFKLRKRRNISMPIIKTSDWILTGKPFIMEVFDGKNLGKISSGDPIDGDNTPVEAWRKLYRTLRGEYEAYKATPIPYEEVAAYALGALSVGGDILDLPEAIQKQVEFNVLDGNQRELYLNRLAMIFLQALSEKQLRGLVNYYAQLGIEVKIPKFLWNKFYWQSGRTGQSSISGFRNRIVSGIDYTMIQLGLIGVAAVWIRNRKINAPKKQMSIIDVEEFNQILDILAIGCRDASKDVSAVRGEINSLTPKEANYLIQSWRGVPKAIKGLQRIIESGMGNDATRDIKEKLQIIRRDIEIFDKRNKKEKILERLKEFKVVSSEGDEYPASQIGKRAHGEITSDGKLKVTDSRGDVHMLDLAPHGPLDVKGFEAAISDMRNIENGHQKIILGVLKLLEASPPEVYTYNELIEDLFGVADKGSISVFEGSSSDRIVLFHEAAHFLIDKGALTLEFIAEENRSYIKVGSLGKIELTDAALAIAKKDIRDPHYLLRAIQRQAFKKSDLELTSLIKRAQSINMGDRLFSAQLREAVPEEKPAAAPKEEITDSQLIAAVQVADRVIRNSTHAPTEEELNVLGDGLRNFFQDCFDKRLFNDPDLAEFFKGTDGIELEKLPVYIWARRDKDHNNDDRIRKMSDIVAAKYPEFADSLAKICCAIGEAFYNVRTHTGYSRSELFCGIAHHVDEKMHGQEQSNLLYHHKWVWALKHCGRDSQKEARKEMDILMERSATRPNGNGIKFLLESETINLDAVVRPRIEKLGQEIASLLSEGRFIEYTASLEDMIWPAITLESSARMREYPRAISFVGTAYSYLALLNKFRLDYTLKHFPSRSDGVRGLAINVISNVRDSLKNAESACQKSGTVGEQYAHASSVLDTTANRAIHILKAWRAQVRSNGISFQDSLQTLKSSLTRINNMASRIPTEAGPKLQAEIIQIMKLIDLHELVVERIKTELRSCDDKDIEDGEQFFAAVKANVKSAVDADAEPVIADYLNFYRRKLSLDRAGLTALYVSCKVLTKPGERTPGAIAEFADGMTSGISQQEWIDKSRKIADFLGMDIVEPGVAKASGSHTPPEAKAAAVMDVKPDDLLLSIGRSFRNKKGDNFVGKIDSLRRDFDLLVKWDGKITGLSWNYVEQCRKTLKELEVEIKGDEAGSRKGYEARVLDYMDRYNSLKGKEQSALKREEGSSLAGQYKRLKMRLPVLDNLLAEKKQNILRAARRLVAERIAERNGAEEAGLGVESQLFWDELNKMDNIINGLNIIINESSDDNYLSYDSFDEGMRSLIIELAAMRRFGEKLATFRPLFEIIAKAEEEADLSEAYFGKLPFISDLFRPALGDARRKLIERAFRGMGFDSLSREEKRSYEEEILLRAEAFASIRKSVQETYRVIDCSGENILGTIDEKESRAIEAETEAIIRDDMARLIQDSASDDIIRPILNITPYPDRTKASAAIKNLCVNLRRKIDILIGARMISVPSGWQNFIRIGRWMDTLSPGTFPETHAEKIAKMRESVSRLFDRARLLNPIDKGFGDSSRRIQEELVVHIKECKDEISDVRMKWRNKLAGEFAISTRLIIIWLENWVGDLLSKEEMAEIKETLASIERIMRNQPDEDEADDIYINYRRNVSRVSNLLMKISEQCKFSYVARKFSSLLVPYLTGPYYEKNFLAEKGIDRGKIRISGMPIFRDGFLSDIQIMTSTESPDDPLVVTSRLFDAGKGPLPPDITGTLERIKGSMDTNFNSRFFSRTEDYRRIPIDPVHFADIARGMLVYYAYLSEIVPHLSADEKVPALNSIKASDTLLYLLPIVSNSMIVGRQYIEGDADTNLIMTKLKKLEEINKKRPLTPREREMKSELARLAEELLKVNEREWFNRGKLESLLKSLLGLMESIAGEKYEIPEEAFSYSLASPIPIRMSLTLDPGTSNVFFTYPPLAEYRGVYFDLGKRTFRISSRDSGRKAKRFSAALNQSLSYYLNALGEGKELKEYEDLRSSLGRKRGRIDAAVAEGMPVNSLFSISANTILNDSAFVEFLIPHITHSRAARLILGERQMHELGHAAREESLAYITNPYDRMVEAEILQLETDVAFLDKIYALNPGLTEEVDRFVHKKVLPEGRKFSSAFNTAKLFNNINEWLIMYRRGDPKAMRSAMRIFVIDSLKGLTINPSIRLSQNQTAEPAVAPQEDSRAIVESSLEKVASDHYGLPVPEAKEVARLCNFSYEIYHELVKQGLMDGQTIVYPAGGIDVLPAISGVPTIIIDKWLESAERDLRKDAKNLLLSIGRKADVERAPYSWEEGDATKKEALVSAGEKVKTPKTTVLLKGAIDYILPVTDFGPEEKKAAVDKFIGYVIEALHPDQFVILNTADRNYLLEKLRSCGYDDIVCDWMLPNGYLATLKSSISRLSRASASRDGIYFWNVKFMYPTCVTIVRRKTTMPRSDLASNVSSAAQEPARSAEAPQTEIDGETNLAAENAITLSSPASITDLAKLNRILESVIERCPGLANKTLDIRDRCKALTPAELHFVLEVYPITATAFELTEMFIELDNSEAYVMDTLEGISSNLEASVIAFTHAPRIAGTDIMIFNTVAGTRTADDNISEDNMAKLNATVELIRNVSLPHYESFLRYTRVVEVSPGMDPNLGGHVQIPGWTGFNPNSTVEQSAVILIHENSHNKYKTEHTLSGFTNYPRYIVPEEHRSPVVSDDAGPWAYFFELHGYLDSVEFLDLILSHNACSSAHLNELLVSRFNQLGHIEFLLKSLDFIISDGLITPEGIADVAECRQRYEIYKAAVSVQSIAKAEAPPAKPENVSDVTAAGMTKDKPYVLTLRSLNPSVGEPRPIDSKVNISDPMRFLNLYKRLFLIKNQYSGKAKLKVAVLGPGGCNKSSTFTGPIDYSPQMIEIIATLLGMKIDYTVIDANREVLQAATSPQLYAFDCELARIRKEIRNSSIYRKMRQALSNLMQNANYNQFRYARGGEGRATFTVNPEKLKDISINSFQGHFQDINYGSDELDIVISTVAFDYALRDISNIAGKTELLTRIVKALKPSGKFLLDCNAFLSFYENPDTSRPTSEQQILEITPFLETELEHQFGLKVKIERHGDIVEITKIEQTPIIGPTEANQASQSGKLLELPSDLSTPAPSPARPAEAPLELKQVLNEVLKKLSDKKPEDVKEMFRYVAEIYGTFKKLLGETRQPEKPRYIFMPLPGALSDMKKFAKDILRANGFTNINIIFYDGTLKDLKKEIGDTAANIGTVNPKNGLAYINKKELVGLDRDERERINVTFVKENVPDGGGQFSVGGHVVLALGVLDLISNDRAADSDYWQLVLELVRRISNNENKYKGITKNGFMQKIQMEELEIDLPPIEKETIDRNMRTLAIVEKAVGTSM